MDDVMRDAAAMRAEGNRLLQEAAKFDRQADACRRDAETLEARAELTDQRTALAAEQQAAEEEVTRLRDGLDAAVAVERHAEDRARDAREQLQAAEDAHAQAQAEDAAAAVLVELLTRRTAATTVADEAEQRLQDARTATQAAQGSLDRARQARADLGRRIAKVDVAMSDPVPESESAKVRRLMREWQARVLLEEEQPELTLTPEERQWVKGHVLMFADMLGVARAIENAERTRIREANPPQRFALPGGRTATFLPNF